MRVRRVGLAALLTALVLTLGTVAAAQTTAPQYSPDVPPETVIKKHPKKRTVRSSASFVSFTFLSDEAGSRFQCKIDKKPFHSCGSPDAGGVPDLVWVGFAKHKFRVRAIDVSGDVDASPAEYRFTVVRARKRPQGGGGTGCTAGYSPCIPPGSDVDCAGGGGNGPRYVQGPVTVTGSDPYGLDANNDGVGCET